MEDNSAFASLHLPEELKMLCGLGMAGGEVQEEAEHWQCPGCGVLRPRAPDRKSACGWKLDILFTSRRQKSDCKYEV